MDSGSGDHSADGAGGRHGLLGDRDVSWGQVSGAEPISSLLLVRAALLSGSCVGLALPGAGTRWALHHVLGFEVPSKGGSQPQTQPGAGGSHCVCHTRLQGSLVLWWHIHIVTPVSFLPRQGTEAQSSQSWVTAPSFPARSCSL